ncbi:hypothetical protein BDB00DRAFT_851215 [Zychaea mexicana]|uniref:uncharacterized protein n=1 Tax=Zychaea mexicana TaxID=64656 RepID=UPI0022FEAE20|nr:uncharacterized protein BDB00DRAFT_851215 [Zychaea mexicana]KAI9485134.1 hypothetical protein BDB00DRAFT_851215 [Zychaea mexicana]
MVRGSRFKEHFDYYDIHVTATVTTTTAASSSLTQQASRKSSSLRRNSSRPASSGAGTTTTLCTLKRSPHVKKRQFSRSPSIHPMSRSPSCQQRVLSAASNTATPTATAVVYRASTDVSSPSGRTKFVDWCLKQKAKLLHPNRSQRRRSSVTSCRR